MQFRLLGRSGLRISALSYGSWVTFSNQLDLEQAEEMLKLGYENGINFFDNAEVYAHGASEELMGKALRRLAFERDSYCVSSKVFFGSRLGAAPTQVGLARKHIVEACEAALRRLKVDYLDLYYCHRPDPDVPVEQVVRTMNMLIQQGKILYWGTSEWSAAEIGVAWAIAERLHLEPPTVEQPQYNLFHRRRVEEEYLALYQNLGLGLTTWSPLASGILTGKYANGFPMSSRLELEGYSWLKDKVATDRGMAQLRAAETVAKVAKEVGATAAQLSIAWCLLNPNVSSVILGASRIEQLRENLRSIEFLEKFDAELIQKLNDATGPAFE